MIVNYPPQLNTDQKKLAACYRLIEVARVKHNSTRQAAEAIWEAGGKEKWNGFVKIFKSVNNRLLDEAANLQTAIINAQYTKAQWEALSEDDRRTACDKLYSDSRGISSLVATTASAKILDDLLALDIDNITPIAIVDPNEDYTTWAETDADGVMTVTSGSVSINNATEKICKLVKDGGAGYVTGNFQFFLDQVTYNGLTEAYNYLGWLAVSNQDAYYDTMTSGLLVYRYSGTRFYIEEKGASSTYRDIVEGTNYWLTIQRTNTTFYLYVYTGGRETTLLGSVSIACATTAYRYVNVGYTHSSGTYSLGTWSMQGLDLQLAPPPTLDQSAYRWRDDDADEDEATWLENENTTLTRAKALNTRLRVQLASTNDYPSTPFQLEYKKSDDASYRKVGVGTPKTITFVGGTTAVIEIGNGTNQDVDLPEGIQPGDYVIVALANDNALNADGYILTSGYIDTLHTTGAAPGNQVAYKKMGATPDTVVNIDCRATTKTACAIQVWRNVDPDNPLDVAVTNATGTSGMPNPPAITPATQGALVLAVGLLDDDDAVNMAAPNGYTNLTAGNTGQGSTTVGASSMMASKLWSGSGAEDPGAFTATSNNSDAWMGHTIALRPAFNDPQITLSLSGYIAASAADPTTAQLSVPGGKSFTAGKISDDTNPVTVDIAENRYTELEFCLIATAAAAVDDIYTFRMTANGVAIDTYTVTPQWTIGTPIAPPRHGFVLFQDPGVV